MASTFEIGGALRIRRLMAQKIARREETRLGLKLMPLTEVDAVKIVYERDALLRGVQHARGIDGPTQPVRMPGLEQYASDPGYYGDHIRLGESILLNQRVPGDWLQFDRQGDMTARASTYLEQRQADRWEKNIFDLLVNGYYEGLDAMGRRKVFDIYAINKYTANPLLSDAANSTPLKFFRDTLAAATAGLSVNFVGGEIILNRVTLNQVLANTNAADLGGKRFEYGQTLNAVRNLNDLLLANDLPTLSVYDEGYYPEDSGAFVKFIPNGKAILIGKREDGEPIGEYVLTKAAQKGGQPGWWTDVVDNSTGPLADPPHVLAKAGHNGGPKVYYPEAVLSITLY